MGERLTPTARALLDVIAELDADCLRMVYGIRREDAAPLDQAVFRYRDARKRRERSAEKRRAAIAETCLICRQPYPKTRAEWVAGGSCFACAYEHNRRKEADRG